MEYDYEFVNGPFDLIVTVSGAASAAEMLTRRTDVLADPRLRPGMNVLYDLTSADLGQLSTADLRALADDSRRFEKAAFSSAAIAAPRPLTFGLTRMFEAYAGEIRLADRFTIVETIAEAHAWLANATT